MVLHPYPVPQYCPTGKRACRVDSHHTNCHVLLPEGIYQVTDQCALTRTRGTGDANDAGAPSVKIDALQGLGSARYFILNTPHQPGGGQNIAFQYLTHQVHLHLYMSSACPESFTVSLAQSTIS